MSGAAKKTADHPKYIEMIIMAITNLKARSGSSRQAILKYVKENYTVKEDSCGVQVKLALKRGVASGALLQPKGTGASGSFKVAKETKAETKKPAAKKASAKKPAVAKKPVAKKATTKKSTPKKSTTKKSATKKAKTPAKKPAKKSPAKKKAVTKKTKKPAAKGKGKKPAKK